MMRFLVGDVFDRLSEIPDASVDLVVTSPPFLALRSYLPADHPDKHREIGSELTPAAFIDTLLAVTAELRRVLAPHGSICVELGDSRAGTGGSGGDYGPGGMKDGQPTVTGSALRQRIDTKYARVHDDTGPAIPNRNGFRQGGGPGWPLAKSHVLIPELFRVALAYGVHPLTGVESPAGRWIVRNVVTWCRPNPTPGALSDKWRPATSDVVIAATSPTRYWDDYATRQPHKPANARTAKNVGRRPNDMPSGQRDGNWSTLAISDEQNPAGAPLLDWWELSTSGYKDSHYATFPPALVEPLVKAMCPPRVCVECGEPSRRITASHSVGEGGVHPANNGGESTGYGAGHRSRHVSTHEGWMDCGHNTWRPATVLDPFAGTGTTLLVAHGHGHHAIGIDLDPRNADLALERCGPMFLEVVNA